MILLFLVLMTQHGANPRASGAANNRAFQSAAEQSTDHRSAAAADKRTLTRPYAPVPVSIVVIAPVIVAATTSIAESFVKGATILRTNLETGGHHEHNQQYKSCPQHKPSG